jgi:hypothetical protein
MAPTPSWNKEKNVFITESWGGGSQQERSYLFYFHLMLFLKNKKIEKENKTIKYNEELQAETRRVTHTFKIPVNNI